jgi:hypothetical protein
MIRADPRTNNPASGIMGVAINEPHNEADQFITCDACKQSFDCRDLGQVLHHEEPGHSPLATL